MTRQTSNTAHAVILAGGRSRRMGTDKARLAIGDRTLLQRAVERLTVQGAIVAVNTNASLDGIPPDIVIVPDTMAGFRGPLAGILAAMLHARATKETDSVITISVDSPFFPLTLVERLSDAGSHDHAIVTAACKGRSHPVFGRWPVALAEDLAEWIAGDDLSVRGFLSRHRSVEVDFPAIALDDEELDPFFNINTPEDFERAIAIEARYHP